MEEIKATDIMLNNWFMGYDDKPFQWDAECFYLTQGVVSTNELINTPIPLTEDILLKAGFIKNNKIEYSQDYVFAVNILTKQYIIVRNDVGNDWFYMNSYFKVDTVHHLQNITRVLTGNDLNVEV